MNRAFRPEPEASSELEDAAVWYNSQRPGLGLEFVQAVETTLDHIALWPQIGRRVPGVPADVPVRRFPVPRFPYHLAYMEWEGVIRLLAVAHDSRKPGYWSSRVNR